MNRTNKLDKKLCSLVHFQLLYFSCSQYAVSCKLLIFVFFFLIAAAAAQQDNPAIYVPYKDLPALIEPENKAVLMDRKQFDDLLASARAADMRQDTGLRLGQITQAEYSAEISGEIVRITGKLQVVSISDEPIRINLGFDQFLLGTVKLDGIPAPLGYDSQGRLTLIVAAKGSYQLTIEGQTGLQELTGGGMQFSMSLPQSVAGVMKLRTSGDMEIHSTAPVSETTYSSQADSTSAVLTLGGLNRLTVILTGNGRQEDDRAILLGESSETVNLTSSDQSLGCLYTVQVLRRGVRQLQFRLAQGWTITEVTCPNLVRWSIERPAEVNQPQILTVRLRSARTGAVALHISANTVRESQNWHSPAVMLVDAASQQGYMMVNTDEHTGVRGEKLTSARREDVSAVSVTGLDTRLNGRLYFHWGDKWDVFLELENVALRRTIRENQDIVVTPRQITLTSNFQVTAVKLELFEMIFILRGTEDQWQLKSVLVDQQENNFEYRIEQQPEYCLLRIELYKPLQPESMARVTIVTQHIPQQWDWPSDAPQRNISVPLVESQAESVTGNVSVSAQDDLEVLPENIPAGLENVSVGRMVTLGMQNQIQYAYNYTSPAAAQIQLVVSRIKPRISCESSGLVKVKSGNFTGHWRITYKISRASTKRLYLLAEKSIGKEIQISSQSLLVSSQSIISAQSMPISITEELAGKYDIWQLNLDSSSVGDVVLNIHYDRPKADANFYVPLVRPVCDGQIDEFVAIEADEELALEVDAGTSKEIDAIDLPSLPVEATRIMAAYQFEAVTTASGARASIALRTVKHDNYQIPSALVVSSALGTYLDAHLGQRTVADFRIANASRQFLSIRLPKTAQLWSIQVDNNPVKPQRSSAGDYQISLGKLGKTVMVQVVYAYQPEDADFGNVQLGGIELPGLEINQVSWSVYPPPDYRIAHQQTNMQTSGLQPVKPALFQLYNSLKSFRFRGIISIMPTLNRARERRIQSAVDFAPSSVTFSGGTAYSGGPSGPLQEQTQQQGRPQMAQSPAPAGQQAAMRIAQQPVMLTAQGRYTLPVTLVPTAGAGPQTRFTGIGKSELIVGLTNITKQNNLWILGFIIMMILGLFWARAKTKSILIIVTIAITTFAALWWPAVTSFANGIFWGTIFLPAVFIVVYPVRLVLQRKGYIAGSRAAAKTIVLFIAIAGSTPPAQAQMQAQTVPLNNLSKSDSNRFDEIIVPYSGSPAQAQSSDKVLVPYSRFVQLWNKAHPDDRIELTAAETEISLSNVSYQVTIKDEQFNLLLTANIRTYGKKSVIMPLPISGLAATEVTLNGGSAQLQTVNGNMLLLLPGDFSGQMQLKAAGRPEYLGQRGSISFSLPPLPAAVMTVVLSKSDYQLEIDQLEVEPSQKQINGGTEWSFGLGLTRSLTMRWLPKLTGSSSDTTLSARSEHNVYVFHWAIIGVSKVTYAFAAGEHDRFTLLIPQDTMLTAIDGANVRDYRQTGESIIEGKTYSITEVRLHRPAKKQYELSLRWLREIPSADVSEQLPLVIAGDAGRESGTVTLSLAGGMGMQVTEVTGGRRTELAIAGQYDQANLSSNIAIPTAEYYWPYRPFTISIKLSRLTAKPQVNLDQLVRISKDRVELFAEANIRTEDGKIFTASFELPGGYELLSIVGPAVNNYYERSNSNRNFVHIEFDTGQTQSTIAFVLTRSDVQLGEFSVPVIKYIDSMEQTVTEQKGRLAVQVAASLEAQTLSRENLSNITPVSLSSWLSQEQITQVQFAERYEKPNPSLRLNIRSKPTHIQTETFAGLVIQTTSANYTYRLRYNISGSGVDNLSFRLPDEYAQFVAVESPSLRNVTQTDANDGQTRWTVSLVNEVTGLVDVLLNFALPIDASTQSLAIPRLETDAADLSRTIVAVQNVSRHEISIRNMAELSELALSEQQTRMSPEIQNSLQYVYQSFEKNWSLSLNLTQAKAAARIQAVVDLLALTTVISRDGSCRYEVKVELQNRSEQFLKVKIPAGLKLWSALVASVPVKPVKETNSPETEILIPLIKTSPGGLPYDIVMYFADEDIKPLVRPLNGITRLSLPEITIMDMPVARTTWSLRMPGGYRYMKPGGNMSPVAGTVEMLSLGIEARLEQLTRLEKGYREIASQGKAKQTQIAEENLDYLNKKLSLEVQEAQDYLSSNKAEISLQDYERLRSKLNIQQQTQSVVMSDNYGFIQQQQGQYSNNMNTYLNVSGSNRGVAESVRDNALNKMPEFVGTNEEKQLARLNQQIKDTVEQMNKPADSFASQDTSKLATIVTPGKSSEELISGDKSKEEEISRVLEEVSSKSSIAIGQKQVQLQEQLEQLGNSRLQRYYNADGDRTDVKSDTAQQTEADTRSVLSTRGGRGGGGRGGGRGGISGTTGNRTTTGRAANEPVTSQPLSNAAQAAGSQPGMATSANASASSRNVVLDAVASDAYTSPNIYSLPVTLPAGEIQLDFARSSGDAKLSILAIPIEAITNFSTMIVVMAVLALIFGGVKIWMKYNARKPISVRLTVSYILLCVIMPVILGVLGLVISLIIILIVESLRRIIFV
jgi:hypothetical protein